SSHYDGKIYNLSPQTAIPYDVIPFINTEEVACSTSY
ncbi:3-deoxy-D-manno-oct-2-ulosonate III transferase WaaZ, partial [Citrobacter freundii]